MKREDITKHFPDATKEQIDALLDINSSDIGRAKKQAETDRDSYKSQLETAQNSLKDFEGVDVNGMNGKITAYEQQVQQLQAQLAEAKTSAAIKLGLISEHAIDTDYLSFKLSEKLRSEGKALELDDSGKIKGWDDLLSGLKTQFPTQFAAPGKKHYVEKKLPESAETPDDEPKSLEDALKWQYEQKDE